LENNTADAHLYLNKVTISDIWLVLQQRFSNMEFNSMQSPSHQLDPCGFSLSTPSIVSLDHYDQNQAIMAFLGKEHDSCYNAVNSEVAIIYHELFHVLQANSTRVVFDYFNLVDQIQANRLQLLTYLGELNFFANANDDVLEYCLSVFHSVAQYKNEDLTVLSELSSQDLLDLLEYFSNANDAEIQVFEIIEGSAEVFGWCCGGYSAFSVLDDQIKKREIFGKPHKNSELYTKAYVLFDKSGGKTPILLVILSLISLRYGSLGEVSSVTPSDIFTWGLKHVSLWESDINSILADRKLDVSLFNIVIRDMFEKIRIAAQGQFCLARETAIDEISDDIRSSPFMTTLLDIRGCVDRSDDIPFISELILQKNLPYAIVDIFNLRGSELKKKLRHYRVLQDFEKLLLHKTEWSIDKIYCCSIHREVSIDGAWYDCDHNDSFKVLLFNEFGVTIPEFFYRK
jgi:hypothetical protein